MTIKMIKSTICNMVVHFKKLLFIIILIISLFTFSTSLFTAASVYAEGETSVCDSNAAESVKEAAGCNGSDNLVADIIVNILYIVIFIVGIISAIYIVIGGVKYMSSKGDANATQTAKKTILYSLIGLVITSLAFIIVNFSIGLIYGENSENNGQGSELDDNSEIRKISMINQKNTFIGEKEKLRAHITPMWAPNPTLTWNSSDPSIVSVDNKGNITAIKEGTATITVESENGKSATTKINVIKPIEPESLSVSPSTANVVKGKTFNLKATVLPTNANNKHVDWSSSNTNIATINNRGQITGKKEGTTTITAKTENGKTATVAVKVSDGSGPIKIDQSLLNGLIKYYQTSYNGGSVSCASAGRVSGYACGPFSYMGARYVLTREDTNAQAFVQEACNRWYYGGGSEISKLSVNYQGEYANKYHVRVKPSMTLTWDAVVAELKKGNVIIFHTTGFNGNYDWHQQGFRITDHGHYTVAIGYREQNGGEVYVWSPVPGGDRNIGDCGKGQCWYNKTVFERNFLNKSLHEYGNLFGHPVEKVNK